LPERSSDSFKRQVRALEIRRADLGVNGREIILSGFRRIEEDGKIIDRKIQGPRIALASVLRRYVRLQ
jgi:hypothetical protein